MTEQLTPEVVTSASKNKRTGLIVAFAIILALMALLGWGLKKVQAGPKSSGIAPDFTITDFRGPSFKLSEHRGHVVIVNFWASWCPPCREEAAYLEQTWRKYQDKDVIFVGVDWVDTQKEALAYINEFDITYINGPDVGTVAAQAYNIQGVPETFYVAKNGELRGVHIGPLQSPELDQKIEELLAEKYP
jgi:cytochrome c biogenesis protein CcmG/thiol:disulfide interchange protein DsbE